MVHSRSKESSQQVTDNPAHSMSGQSELADAQRCWTARFYLLAKDIKCIINSQPVLELRAVIAGNSAYDTENWRGPCGDETRCRGDGNKTCDSARAESDRGPFFVEAIIEEHPGHTSAARSSVSDEASHDSTHVCRQGGAAVEAEPANPEENGTKDDMRHVMGSVWETVGIGVSRSLAKHNAVCEGCSTRGDMHRSSTCKVKAAHYEGPACRVPCPACNGVVDNSGPDEDEDAAREHTTSVSSSTDCKCGPGCQSACDSTLRDLKFVRDSREHSLVNGK